MVIVLEEINKYRIYRTTITLAPFNIRGILIFLSDFSYIEECDRNAIDSLNVSKEGNSKNPFQKISQHI